MRLNEEFMHHILGRTEVILHPSPGNAFQKVLCRMLGQILCQTVAEKYLQPLCAMAAL